MLERDVYSQSAFKEMSKHYVFVKINGDHNRELMSQYKVSAYPTLKFMRADGSVMKTHVGYLPLADLLKMMNSARGA